MRAPARTPSRDLRALLALLGLCAVLPVQAGEVEGMVSVQAVEPSARTAAPAEPLVIYLTGFDQPPGERDATIEQRNKTFLPGLRVIVAGETVRFTNDDDVIHNVFSTSKSRPFDLGKPHPGQTREVTFPHPGLVEIYCNIHESMYATVLVLPNRAFAIAQVGSDGLAHFTLHDVPPGRHPVRVWGRHLEPTEAEVVVTDSAPAHVALTVRTRAFNPAHLDKYGNPYRPQKGYDK